MDSPSIEDQLIDEIADCTHDPQRLAEGAYEWGKDELDGSTGPRPWQAGVLAEIGNHLSNPVTRFQPCMVAVASGHGIGKSALVSMVIHWAVSTCEDCKVVVTANTGTQLATKTVPEIHKWFRMSINAHWWDLKATSITVRDPKHAMTWGMDAVPWSEYNTEAFAGLHNSGKRILLVFDEASAIADKVWEVAEGALTDKDAEIIWLAFGNPTQNTGRFRECFGRLKHRWKTFQIDSRTVEGTNKAQIEKWVADYGEDSDFVRVRVRGEFPRAGSQQFISSDVVDAARKYVAEGYEGLPKILAVDVARFGADETVIGWRQGRKAVILATLRGLSTAQVAERVIEFMGKESPDAIVIDEDGVGGGVIDHMEIRGYGERVHGFHGGATANDSGTYFNRRAEVWGLMRDWLNTQVEIPDDPDLCAQLCALEYGFSNKGQIQLERKEDLKKRFPEIGSPDRADMLAMTFAVKVAAPAPKPEERMRYPGENKLGWMGS